MDETPHQEDLKVCHQCSYEAPAEDPPGPECPECEAFLIDKTVHEAHPKDTMLGQVIGRKYPIVGVLGAGGMGSVYRAIQQPVGRKVALKVIRNLGEDAEGVQKRFELEAAVVAGLSHPNTVTLYDFGVHDDGTLYMVLELVKGKLLTEVISEAAIECNRAVAIVAGVLDALVEAHSLGLVHRDLKPDNIMLSDTAWGQEGIKVLDFGLAKALGGNEGAAEKNLTQAGVVFGTPRYMAPEQARGKQVTPQADLYAMGLILYECLSGKPAFDADNTFDILAAQISGSLPAIDKKREVPQALLDALEKSVAKKPEDRYQNAALMADAIRSAVGLAPEASSASMAMPTFEASASAAPSQESPPGSTSAAPSTAEESATSSGPTYVPAGATSQEFSAEMVAYSVGGGGAGKVGMAVAVVVLLALAGGGWMFMGSDGASSPAPQAATEPTPAPASQNVTAAAPPPVAATPAPAAPPAPVQPASGRAQAESLDGEGLNLLSAGKAKEALAKFRAASSADPRFAPALYHQAAVHATSKAVWPTIAALEAYLEIAPEPTALSRKLRGDPDFGAIMAGDKDFEAWLVRRGLQKAKPTKKKKKKRKKRRKPRDDMEVPTF